MRSYKHSKVDELLTTRKETLQICLFFANAALIGKTGESRNTLIEKFSTDIARVLCLSQHTIKVHELIPTIRLSLTNTKEEQFLLLFKDYTQKRAVANRISYRESLIHLLSIANRLNKELPGNLFDKDMLAKCERAFKLIEIEKNAVLKKNPHQDSVTLSKEFQTGLEKNNEYRKLFLWAEEMDVIASQAIVAKQKTREGVKDLLTGNFGIKFALLCLLGLAFSLGIMICIEIYNPRLADAILEWMQADVTLSYYITRFTGFAAILASSAAFLKYYEKRNDQKDIADYHEHLNQLRLALEQYFTIKHTIYFDEKMQVQDRHKISLTSSQNNVRPTNKFFPLFNTIEERPLVQKTQKPKKPENKHVTKIISGATPAEKPSLIQYSSTPQYFERLVVRDASKIKVRLPRALLTSIDDKTTLKRVCRSFQESGFTGVSRFQILAEKNQIELTLPGSDYRLFGQKIKIDDEEIFVMKEYRRGLHS